MSATIRRHGLSKSKITMFEQCPKRLWLATHRPELAELDEGAEARFQTGHEVGALACSLCPGGVMVDADPDLRAALEKTRQLLVAEHAGPIFEATLEHEGVLVRVDILERDEDGEWHMAEVKSSTKAKDNHLGDLATQLWVVRNAGLPIKRASIRHINNQFVLESDGNYDGLLIDADLTAEAEAIAADRAAVVAETRKTLAGPEPDIEMGDQCTRPFACEFAAYCNRSRGPGPKWPVSIFPNRGGEKWLGEGIDDLLELDPDLLTNDTQRRIHAATTTGEPYHNPEGAGEAIGKWAYPRAWLDFETIAFAIPRWMGTRPYQQIPFQFSAHIEASDGSIEHREFLSFDGNDPRRACAEALLSMLPGSGAVIGYNASFEQRCILDLADAFPDLASALRELAARVVDLLPVARAHWYHRDQRGSWSIKAVLPTIDVSLDYSNLEIKDGGNAQAAYLEAIEPECDADRRTLLEEALKIYCGRDTWAMIEIARRLASR